MTQQLDDFRIRPFAPADQASARGLILEGLVEHFGAPDDRFNHDLDDIATYYANANFLVAESGGIIVGTGCLVPQTGELAQIVRMSVERSKRRRGVGHAIVDALLSHARARGFGRVILTTNESWEDAIDFYTACGFHEIARANGGVLFEMVVRPDLDPSPSTLHP